MVVGSDGLHKIGLNAAGQTGKLNYLLDYTRFQTDWLPRPQRRRTPPAQREAAVDATDQTRFTVVMNLFDRPGPAIRWG